MGQVQRGSIANRESAKVDCRRLSTPEEVIAFPKRWVSVKVRSKFFRNRGWKDIQQFG